MIADTRRTWRWLSLKVGGGGGAAAAQWVRAAGATYSGYVELRIARDFGDVR